MRLGVIWCGLLVLGGFASQPAGAQGNALSQRLDVERHGFAVRYPAGWSAAQRGEVVWIGNSPLERATTEAFDRMVHIYVTVETRRDHAEAVRRLRDIASEYAGPVNYLTIGGWPAIERSVLAPKPQPGGNEEQDSQEQQAEHRRPDKGAAGDIGDKILRVTTAIAAGNLLIRADGRMPPEVSREIQNQVRAIEAGILPRALGNGADTTRELRELRNTPRLAPSRPPASKMTPAVPRQNLRSAARPGAAPASAGGSVAVRSGTRLLSFAGPPSLEGGLAQRVINGGFASEPEIAVSTDGQKIVIAQQFNFSTSNDGGQTFPFGGSFASSDGGDSSVAYGKSGNFYEGTIFKTSSALNFSTDNGQTFAFRANAYTCPSSPPNQCGFSRGNPPAPFPDQEHIAADRYNSGASGDQVYFVWRNDGSNYGIACSTDSGQNFGAAQYSPGDFPRVTVGQDGFVYAAYVNGGNIELDKYSSCQSGLAKQGGFPVTVASGISVTCPMPGLDRCYAGANRMESYVVAIDDTNPNHVYMAYAQTTSSTNESVVIRDSTDGGSTWPAGRVVTVSSGIVARRFMPWVCSIGGVAHASWYDRRAAGASNNDLTDYYAASAFLDGASNLVGGTELQINAPGSSDAQCNAGKATGSTGSWPVGSRAKPDSTTCTAQPQLGGLCKHSPSTKFDSRQNCNFSGANTCPATESCQTDSGWPKYGDYNGNACAAGRLYTIWASATPPPSQTATGNVDLFFASNLLCCSAQIQVPGPILFPETCVGQTSIATANVCNTGKVDLSVDPITSSDIGEFWVVTPSSGYPVTIAPGSCFPFQARFRPSSPGSKSATLTIPSNDPVTPNATVLVGGIAGQPTVATAIANMGDYGTVCPGAFKDLELTIQNSGKCPLVISGLSSNSADFKTATVVAFPITVAPGSSVEIPIRFEPSSPGAKSGVITVNTNDPLRPAAAVNVQGVGGQPVIATVIADTGDFGTLCRGLFRDLPLTIQNNGTCPLHVTNITSSSPEFETAQVQSYPLTIAPGVSMEIPIRYRPASSGSKTATITIASDDPAAPSKTVQVKAHTPPEYICHPPTFAAVGLNAGPTFGSGRTGDFNFEGYGRFLTPFGVRKTYGVQAQGDYLYYDQRQEAQFDAGLLVRLGRFQPGVFGDFKYAQWNAYQNGSGLGQVGFTLDFLFLQHARFGIFGSKGFRDYGVVNRVTTIVTVPPGVTLEQNAETHMKVVDQFGGSGQVRLPHRIYLEGDLERLDRYAPGLPDRPGAAVRFIRQWRQIGFLAEFDYNETFVGRQDSGRVVFGVQLGHWPRPSDLADKRNPLGTAVPRVHYELLQRVR